VDVFDGLEALSRSQAVLFQDVIRKALVRGLRFAVGGSLAMAYATGIPRPSEDLDIYVLRDEKEPMIQLLAEMEFLEYTAVPYDHTWVYRLHRETMIVNVIWAMANHRAQVDLEWLLRGSLVDLGTERFRLIPVEEMIWSKLYVLQRDRCDWPDVFNLIHAAADRIDWDHLLNRVQSDAPLLYAALEIYCWLKPDSWLKFPVWLRGSIRHPGEQNGGLTQRRANLLDARPWFVSLLRKESVRP
jgi:hypothetical protein